MYVSGFVNTGISEVFFLLQDLLVMNVSTQASSKKSLIGIFNLISEIIAAIWKPCKLSKVSERWLREPPCQFVTFEAKTVYSSYLYFFCEGPSK